MITQGPAAIWWRSGVAGIDMVSRVISAGGNLRGRAKLGGEGRIATFLLKQMAAK